jgi:hypothetical protein
MSSESSLPLAEILRRGADRIYNLIMHSDLEWIDIEIQIDALRDLCRADDPGKLDLFDAIYASRFERLWEQWRLKGDTSWTWRDEDDDGPAAFA